VCLLVPGYVGVHRGHAVAEHDDAHDGGRDQQLGVNAEPREVEADLLPEVLPAGSEVTEVTEREVEKGQIRDFQDVKLNVHDLTFCEISVNT